MSVIWTPLRLVVEDHERAIEAESATRKSGKEATVHINGNALSSQDGRNYFHNNHHSSQNSQISHHGQLPPYRYNSFGCPVPLNRISPDRATEVITTSPTKTKLRSFQERDKSYYHDAKYLQTEQCMVPSNQNYGEPSEKDDEGGHPSDEGIKPLQDELKNGPSSLYVRLPKVPISETDSAATLLKNQTLTASREFGDPCEPPSKGGPTNNNKEPEGEVESSCLVDCLYYTIVCCDCSIM